MEQPVIIASPITGRAGAESGDGGTVAQTALSYDDYRYTENCPVRWVLTSTRIRRNTLYTANRDISYYTIAWVVCGDHSAGIL